MASVRDKNAQALTAREEGMQEQINKLSSALALIAEEQAKFRKAANKENTPPRRRKKHRYSSDASDDSSSNDEPTLPPQPRKKKKKKKARKEGKREYQVGDEFKIGMEFNEDWSYKKGQQFLSARGRFWNTKTLPALKHRRKHLKQQLKVIPKGTSKYKYIKKALERVNELIKKKKKADK